MDMTEVGDLAALPKRQLRPVNLIPVCLKEAAWDSPSFRASVIHTSDQVDAVEKWLEGCIRATSRLSAEANTLENLIASFVSATVAPSNLSEAVVDHDYSLVAAKRFSEAAKDSWIANVTELKKLDTSITQPLRQFEHTDLRHFRDYRRTLEQSQKVFDQLQTRYSAQAKTKEPSSLREDAFQLHEARKAYLKASLDFATAVPQFKFALDKILARVFADQTQAMRASRDATSLILGKYAVEVGRIRSWSKELESGEKAFRKELLSTRTQIEESAELATRPARELEDYQISSANIKGPTSNLQANPSVTANGKQGWLNMKIVTGKPTRTVWIRRWFFVKNGVFGWLVQGSRSGGIEESERIGVLLCGLRPASNEERRFCFEVKTKDITIVLQADSQSDLAKWMIAFDLAKKKALEDPASTTTITSPSQPLDLAFAISPPSTTEFAASAVDVGLTSDDPQDRAVGGSLGVPSDPMSPHRGSFDVTASRRSTALEPDTGASRRKPSGTPQLGSTTVSPSPSAGIAGLISASSMNLALGAGVMQPISNDQNKPFTSSTSRTPLNTIIRALPKTSLAPSTLVTPPMQTNLSNATVVLNGEKGNASAQLDLIKGTPSGMMANSWGSLNWGYNNYLERHDLQTCKVVDPESTVGTAGDQDRSPERPAIIRQQSPVTTRGHRKTVSLDGDAADLLRTIIAPGKFPANYPTILKHHDAQFRVFFPNVSRDEKLVMVFRATWNPSEQGDFPGRIYATAKDMYFYSNHLGLVLTSSLPLARVTEITAAPGRECDYLFVHLKPNQNVDYTRITVKIFLEPLKLLQKRLNYLVQNASLSRPDDLDAIMKALIQFEQPDSSEARSPSVGSIDGHDWDNSPLYGERTNAKDLRTRLHVDRDLAGLKGPDEKERIKLPSRPVNYVPNGMSNPAVEMNIKISPKALFHILFGDRSAIWQLLYHQRGAKGVRQHPWSKPDQGFWRREFNYRIPHGISTGLLHELEVIDSQTVDVLSEHLCYVVTERKSSWFLPLSKQFELVSKIVITHVSKSNCKLAIYTAVQWSKHSMLTPLINRSALAGLKLDALDLMDVVSEQVNRLGSQAQSKRAIQIFGQIGQDTQTIEFKGTDSSTSVPRVRHMSRRKTIVRLFLEAYGSFIKGCINIVLAQIIAIFDWCTKTFDANFWLVLICIASLLINAFYSSGLAFSWWQDLRAGQYMRNIGLTQDLTLTKAINLSDLDLLTTPTTATQLHDNLCFQTFKKGLFSSSSSSPTLSPTISSSSSRLRKSQALLSTYRHDLLVAMRVVNSMEQALVRAEWEYWLEDEAKKCDRVRKMLAKPSLATGDTAGAGSGKKGLLGLGLRKGKALAGSGSTTAGTGNQTSAQQQQQQLKALEKYCASCEDSLRTLKERE